MKFLLLLTINVQKGIQEDYVSHVIFIILGKMENILHLHLTSVGIARIKENK